MPGRVRPRAGASASAAWAGSRWVVPNWGKESGGCRRRYGACERTELLEPDRPGAALRGAPEGVEVTQAVPVAVSSGLAFEAKSSSVPVLEAGPHAPDRLRVYEPGLTWKVKPPVKSVERVA
jgi:hypothetical protein